MSKWLLVDDAVDESKVFSQQLSTEEIQITPISAKEAEQRLVENNLDIDGILMDVDLSNETGMRTTGPGIAQNIRVAQQRQAIPSFPIIRFSARARVLENIGHDSSSDDVFDLKIEKDGLSNPEKERFVKSQLLGIAEINKHTKIPFDPEDFFNLDSEKLAIWGHQAFEKEIANANRPYLASGRVVRLLTHAGVFIDEDLLAIRLGIDKENSADWPLILNELSSIKYTGIACNHMPRWWARGLEEWWSTLGSHQPLAGANIQDRHNKLIAFHSKLCKLAMPDTSLGNRPWRTCLLSFEDCGEIVPVDPSKGVSVTPRESLPLWMDPLVACLGLALRFRDDPRLSKTDLTRLRHFAQGG